MGNTWVSAPQYLLPPAGITGSIAGPPDVTQDDAGKHDDIGLPERAGEFCTGPGTLPFLGLLLYIVATIVRPHDWRGYFFYEFPIENFIWVGIVITRLCSPAEDRLRRIFSLQITKIVLLYALVMIASIAAQGDMEACIFQASVYAKLFAIFLGVAVVADNMKRIAAVLGTVIAMNVFLAYESRIMADEGTNISHQHLYWAARVRWVGMYDDSNSLCMLFAIALVFALQFVTGPWRRYIRLAALGACVWIAKGISLTQSRGGYLALMFAVIMLVFINGRRMRTVFSKKRVIAAVMVGLVLFAMKPERMEKVHDSDGSSDGRIEAWRAGMQIISANPVLGVGIGQWMKHFYRKAHNTFIQVAAETGLAGLFTLMALYFATTGPLLLFLKRLRNGAERCLAGALAAGMVVYIVASYFMSTNTMNLPFIFAGLTASLVDLKGINARLRGCHWIAVGACAIGVLVVAYVNMLVFWATE
jgi:O-antigen ligase